MDIHLRKPRIEDGLAVNQLIAQCPPLDTNSSYCNFLQTAHFKDTSVAAFAGDDLVGFISGYIPPAQNDCLFIWQVAVADKARGLGLASRMLTEIVDRSENGQVHFLETTITEDNQASWALFKSFAKKRKAALSSSSWLDKQQHFKGQHETEFLVRIGPFTSPLKPQSD